MIELSERLHAQNEGYMLCYKDQDCIICTLYKILFFLLLQLLLFIKSLFTLIFFFIMLIHFAVISEAKCKGAFEAPFYPEC